MIIYTLRCENNKFYVGKTNNIKKRFQEHIAGFGSKWTKLYKPIEIYDNFESYDAYDEDKQTLKMMKSYNIDNVRGGSWTNLKLYPNEIKMIQKMIFANNDQCFHCGHNGHFVRECPDKLDKPLNEESVIKCFKCNSEDHRAWDCDISCWTFLTSCFKTKPQNDYVELGEC